MIPTPNPARFIPQGIIPTEEQTKIQLSQRKVTLIEANAGAAKTTTLALRIGEALTRGMPPEKILALTFTPEAKDVMKARLVELGMPSATTTQIHVRTFEEFAAEVLRHIEEGDLPPVVTAQDLKWPAIEAINRVSDHYIGKVDFLDIQTHNIAISQFLECQLQLKATLSLEIDVLGMPLAEIAEQLDVPLTDYLTTLEYETIRLGNGDEILFRGPFDATYDLARNLVSFPDTRETLPPYLPHYGLVVCDELHDLNEASFQILSALLALDKLYFVGAGDKDQVIHSKLGADAMFLKHRFNDSFPGTVRLPLTMTYRHGPHLAYAMEAFKQKPVDSNLPLHTAILQLHYQDSGENMCADKVIDAINKWKTDKKPLEACAILLRDRHQSISIENALMHAEIGYRTLGMQSYLQREEILFLRGMIAIALKNLSSVKSEAVRKAIVESLAIFGELEFTPKEMEYAKREISEVPENLSYFFSGQIQRSESVKARSGITDVVAYMEGLSAETSAASALHEICTRIDIKATAKRIYVHPHDAAVVAKSVDGFIAVAQQNGMNLRQFSEWIGAADAFVASKKSKNIVLIECVANAKGKEFYHVILPFLENGEFPSAMQDFKEEENLFYVGATRAKCRLTLISPNDDAKRSSFIARMKLSSSNTRANSAVENNQTHTIATPTRTDLTVPYADKDVVNALGAQWDATRKVWYVKAGLDLKPFKQWLPK